MNKREIIARLLKNTVGVFDLANYSVRYDRAIKEISYKPVFPDRLAMHAFLAEPMRCEPVTYLEFGVWQGEMFRNWLAWNDHRDSRFIGFDSFEGLPEDWVKGQPKGTFSTGGKPPEVSDPRASFQVGWFQDTLYSFLSGFSPENRLVIHIDCDLYSSTLFVLTSLDRHLPAGTIIIFDDFHSLVHEFAAWLDYRRSFNREWEPLAMVKFGIQVAYRLVR